MILVVFKRVHQQRTPDQPRTARQQRSAYARPTTAARRRSLLRRPLLIHNLRLRRWAPPLLRRRTSVPTAVSSTIPPTSSITAAVVIISPSPSAPSAALLGLRPTKSKQPTITRTSPRPTGRRARAPRLLLPALGRPPAVSPRTRPGTAPVRRLAWRRARGRRGVGGRGRNALRVIRGVRPRALWWVLARVYVEPVFLEEIRVELASAVVLVRESESVCCEMEWKGWGTGGLSRWCGITRMEWAIDRADLE
ncbi:hypothetical protein BOTBODRAFT_408565 [Botryobasidium botryosum FD-172 SS1]|uniref:Uncharacterized protein n=1 Tax=Botryobasidium botryosum (strain FD-172 SS1) TaxID=930990 RepID=A0A067MLE7_BOTB1|nr:hypothetical protein BOTBODRAFT_408565 [Botryobasidium botryosum FD-172 SS1]